MHNQANTIKKTMRTLPLKQIIFPLQIFYKAKEFKMEVKVRITWIVIEKKIDSQVFPS
jgi:hypothetical protein